MAEAKEQLRLFHTLDSKRGAAKAAAAAAATATKQREAALATGSSPRLPIHAVSCRHDQATSALLLHIVAHGYATSGSAALPGFDRSGSSGSSAEERAAEGQLAAAFADRLVPGWWHLTRGLLWRWHLRRLMETPCWGVPGLSAYYRARAAWLREQIQLAIDGDGCRQVVLLRPGLSAWSHSLAQPGVKFFEVDSRPAVQRKKQLLDQLLPGWRHAAQRPRFVEVDFASDSALKLLLTELTGAGFDPSERCCVVAEGLLPFLSQDQTNGLLADLSALAAPGSRLLFDFVHADTLDALLAAANLNSSTGSSNASSSSGPSGTEPTEVLPGLANLAAALANKGAPLRSGLPASFSGLVKFLQPHNFRLSALLPPHEVGRYASQQAQQQQQQQLQGPAVPAEASGCKGSPAGSKGPTSKRLPYVPEFYSFASAVKQDPRLLLRHADLAVATAGASEAAGSGYGLAAGWEAVRGAALGSPSCLLRSLAFLFCGSTTLAASCWAPTAAVATPAMEATAVAAPDAVYPAPSAPTFPASPFQAVSPAAGTAATAAAADSPAAAPAERQFSTEWSLAVGHFLASRSSSSEPSPAGRSSPQQRAAGTAQPLSHAESIAALLPLPAGRSTTSSSCGDEGHLWAAAAGTSPSGTGQHAADGGHLVGAPAAPTVAAGEPGTAATTAAAAAEDTAGVAAPAAAAPTTEGAAGASMVSAAASVAALAAEIAAAIEHDFDSHSTGEGYWWMWTS